MLSVHHEDEHIGCIGYNPSAPHAASPFVYAGPTTRTSADGVHGGAGVRTISDGLVHLTFSHHHSRRDRTAERTRAAADLAASMANNTPSE